MTAYGAVLFRFGGSVVDGLVSGAFGATLCFLQLYAARKNAIFSNIFEISIAALISFISRGLSTTDLFCYEALSSAGVVLVLPGYVIRESHRRCTRLWWAVS